MGKKLVFCTDPKIQSGGFADRISGMAALHKFAKTFGIEFKIYFRTPFDFFDVFPQKKTSCEFDINKYDSSDSNFKIFNLLDNEFIPGLNSLGNSLTNNNELTALIFLNNIKPFSYDIFKNVFSSVSYSSVEYDSINRHVLYEFGLDFLKPNYSLFDAKFSSLLPEFECDVLGIQIRVGGKNENWQDPMFKVPKVDDIISKIKELQISFDKIFVCSDDIILKNNLIDALSVHHTVIFYDNIPLHVDRSSLTQKNFITNSIGDHCLLRLCNVGVIVGEGGYGQTAAILSGSPFFRLT